MPFARSRIATLIRLISLITALALASLACGIAGNPVVERTIIVVVTPTPGETQPTPSSAAASQAPAIPTPLPASPAPLQPAATQSPTQPPAPRPPSPTPLALKSVPVEGDATRVKGEILYPDLNPFSSELVFQVKVRNPEAGGKDGAGIQAVDFSITLYGQEVYSHTEKTPAYCAFGGGEPYCNVFNFAENQYLWPGTHVHLQDGTYTLNVTIHTKSGETWGGQTTFDIKLP